MGAILHHKLSIFCSKFMDRTICLCLFSSSTDRNKTNEVIMPVRTRRSVKSKMSKQRRNIEILVVADDKMVKKYGTEEATTYILTVMNMVRRIVSRYEESGCLF